MKNPISTSLLICLILFCGCSKNSSEQSVTPPPIPPVTPPADNSPDIYAAGRVYRGNAIAAYWKNDSVVELTEGPINAGATGIAVLGKDVYVSGYYDNGSGVQGCYWKNGRFVDLAHGFSFETANAIGVKGPDIYIAGYGVNASSHRVAELWKNGVRTQISPDSCSVEVSGMYISGDDVYVVGNHNTPSNLRNVLTVWKNGIQISVTDGTMDTKGSDIFVSGNDVYISGQELIPSAGVGTYLAKYWKNGQSVVLADSSATTFTTSIFVSGTDIYTTGYEEPGGVSDPTFYKIGRFWKNGALVDLPGGTKSSEVINTAFWNSDLYIAAVDVSTVNGKTSAYYFKNNSQMFFLDGINRSGIISRIILVPKS